MSVPKDNFVLVVDCAATTWEGQPPRGQQPDIIEIGICTINLKTFGVTESLSYLIKPTSSTVSAYCERISGWTQAQVNKGMPFKKAVDHLEKTYKSHGKIVATYNSSDISFLKKQCQHYEVDYPFSSEYIDVKALCSVFLGRTDFVFDDVLKILDLTYEGTQYSGMDAAYNVARVLKELIKHGRKLFVEGKK